MFEEYIRALFLIFMAEMGDKTQILAIAFATRYKVEKVLAGIFIGAFLNHGLAVMLGAYLSTLVPIQTIQIIAGFSFIGFALWTLRIEEEEEEEENKRSFGAVVTVAIAFFIGELGDKTQLTTIMLAAGAGFPFIILMGTVSGMVVTGGLGIFVGSKLGDKIPELAIKLISASIFMFFGVSKLFASLPGMYINTVSITVFTLVIAGAVIWLLRPVINMRKQGRLSAFKQNARNLYAFYNQIGKHANAICLGENCCGVCQKNDCVIGYTKSLANQGSKGEAKVQLNNLKQIQKSLAKDYDKDKIIEGLSMTLAFIRDNNYSEKDLETVNQIRENFEMILFNSRIKKAEDILQYIRQIEKINRPIADKLTQNLQAVCLHE